MFLFHSKLHDFFACANPRLSYLGLHHLFKYLSIHTWCVVIQIFTTSEELYPAFGLRDIIVLMLLQALS